MHQAIEAGMFFKSELFPSSLMPVLYSIARLARETPMSNIDLQVNPFGSIVLAPDMLSIRGRAKKGFSQPSVLLENLDSVCFSIPGWTISPKAQPVVVRHDDISEQVDSLLGEVSTSNHSN